MAINIPIVTDFNSKGLQDASNAFSNFRTKIGEADGAMGKLKAGFGAAGDFIKANAAAFTAAAGAAIVAFAAKGIKEFTDLALAAGKFADATGLAVDDASRWIEVSGDLGVEAASVQGAINKMNIALSAQKKEFQALGVEVVRTKDGTVDVNKTFLNTVDALKGIPDASERARYSAAILGKSWMDMAEILKMGSGEIARALGEVSDAKVIDPQELQKAKDYRAAMDKLGDAFQDLAIKAGQQLVPAITFLADALGTVLGPLNALPGVTSNWDVAMKRLEQASLRQAGERVTKLNKAFYDNYEAMGRLRYQAAGLGNSIRVLDTDTNGLIDTFDELLGRFDREELIDGMKRSFEEYQKTMLEALASKTPEAANKANDAMKSMVREMANVARQAGITSQEQVKIVALLEKGQYDAAYQELLRQIAAVPRQIPIEFIGSVSGIPVPSGQTPSETIGRNPGAGFGGLPNVGGGKGGAAPTRPIIGAFNLMPTSSAGTNVTVNVAGSVTSENDLVESIRKGLVNAQRNGSGLVYSNF